MADVADPEDGSVTTADDALKRITYQSSETIHTFSSPTFVFVICLPKFDATDAADFTDPNMFNCHRVERK